MNHQIMDILKCEAVINVLKKKKLIFTLILFFLIFFSLNVSATTNVTVISPNGGETWFGAHNLLWNFNDTTISQNIDFNLWYSNPAGQKNFLIAQNLDFNNYCSVGAFNSWTDITPNYLTGLPSLSNVVSISDWNYNSVNYITFILGNKTIKTYKWDNAISTWIDSNITWDSISNCTMPDTYDWGLTIFNLNNSEYALLRCNSSNTPKGFKFDGNEWKNNSDVNNGISMTQCINGYMTGIKEFKIGNTNYLVAASTKSGCAVGYDIWGYVWNGSSWTSNSQIINFDSTSGTNQPLFFTSIYYDGNYYFIQEFRDANAKIFKWNGSGWNLNSDINTGFPYYYNNGLVSLVVPSYINSETIPILLRGQILRAAAALGNQTFEFSQSKQFEIDAYHTDINSSCSYPWNTMGALDGNWWLDIEVNGSSKSLDSSNSYFTIVSSLAEVPITQTTLRVFRPKDETYNTIIDGNWNIALGQDLVMYIQDINADYYDITWDNDSQKIVIIDINMKSSNYFPRRYTIITTGEESLYLELQPYLISTEFGSYVRLHTLDAYSNNALPNINVEIYRLIGEPTKSLVSQVVTDSKGTAGIFLQDNSAYEIKTYYDNNKFLKTFNIISTSTDIYLYLVIPNETTILNDAYGFNFSYTPMLSTIKKSTGTIDFSQTITNLSNKNVYYVSSIIQNGVILNSVSETSSDSIKNFTHTINWTDINAGTVYSRVVVTIDSNSYQFQKVYTINSGSFGETYTPIYGLLYGLRQDVGCTQNGLCSSLLTVSIIVSIVFVIWLSFIMGQFQGQSAVIGFLVVMGFFTFINWVPVELTAALALIALAFLINERRS